jgi:hypothetical protein
VAEPKLTTLAEIDAWFAQRIAETLDDEIVREALMKCKAPKCGCEGREGWHLDKHRRVMEKIRGPVGSESTPPFGGDKVHRGVDGAVKEVPFGRQEAMSPAVATDHWKTIANEQAEEVVRLHGCIDAWRDREELLMAQIAQLKNPEDEVISNPAPRSDEAKAYLRMVSKCEPYVESVESINGHGLPIFFEAKPDLEADLDAVCERMANEGTEEDHGDGEEYGRGTVDTFREVAAMLDAKSVPQENRTLLIPAVEGQTLDQTLDRVFGPEDDEREHDAVNSPSHYLNEGGIECIDALRDALGLTGFTAGCRFAAMKYLWRAGKKGDFVEDLEKAVWFTRMAAGDDPRKESA